MANRLIILVAFVGAVGLLAHPPPAMADMAEDLMTAKYGSDGYVEVPDDAWWEDGEGKAVAIATYAVAGGRFGLNTEESLDGVIWMIDPIMIGGSSGQAMTPSVPFVLVLEDNAGNTQYSTGDQMRTFSLTDSTDYVVLWGTEDTTYDPRIRLSWIRPGASPGATTPAPSALLLTLVGVGVVGVYRRFRP